jgi:hypothetical protein
MSSHYAEMVADDWGQKVVKPVKCRHLTNPGGASQRTFYLGERAVIFTCIHEPKSFREG